ncbi:hypothetical protein KI387_008823, partial [Taxus chinensis]
CLSVSMPMVVKATFSKPQGISSVPSISAAGEPLPVPGQPSQIFVDYHIYKGKGALCMTPIAPAFSLLDSGSIKISKVGCVLLQFAHSVGERQYDWKKCQAFLMVIDSRLLFISDCAMLQSFALSVTELGSLLSLSANESCEFFHDPFKGKSDQGKVRKVLQVTPLPSGPGYFFTLKVADEILKIEERFNVPITKAEFTVMQTTFN